MERQEIRPSTQQIYPRRAVARTILATVIAWVPIIAAGLTFLATGDGRPPLSDRWELWISAAAVWATAISGMITRIMANPTVDYYMSKINLSSRPM